MRKSQHALHPMLTLGEHIVAHEVLGVLTSANFASALIQVSATWPSATASSKPLLLYQPASAPERWGIRVKNTDGSYMYVQIAEGLASVPV